MADQATKEYEEKLSDVIEYIENELRLGTQITQAKVSSVKCKVTEAFLLISNLYGRIEQLKDELKDEKDRARSMLQQPTSSYASIVREGIKQDKVQINKIKPEGTTLLITPKEGDDTRKTERKIREILKPRADKIKIKNIRTTKSTIIIETEDKGDTDKILANVKLKENMKIERPKKKKPKIIMYDIPNNLSIKEITDSIYEQNFEDSIKRETFDEDFQLKFKTGPKDKETAHHVAEVSPRIRNQIIHKGRIYLAFLAVAVKDFLVVTKCLKCQDYGHIAKYCRSETRKCEHCGERSHERKDCPNKEELAICIPCSIRGKKCTKTGKEFKECEMYKIFLAREREKTEYE